MSLLMCFTVMWMPIMRGIQTHALASRAFFSTSRLVAVEYFRHLLRDLDFSQLSATLLGEDDISCIYLQSKTFGAMKRSKHIYCRVYRLRDLHAAGIVTLWKVSTGQQAADPLTKSLGVSPFMEHCDGMLRSIRCAPLRD